MLGVPLSLLGNRPFLFPAGILPLCVRRTTKPGVRVASTPSPRPPRPSGHQTTARALLFPQPGTNTPCGSVHADEALAVSVLCVLGRWAVACKERLQQGGPVLTTPSSWSSCVFVHAQSRPTLCDPVDCRLPRSSVRGISQARTLEWVAMPFSRGSSRPRDRTHVSSVSRTGRQVLYC